MITTLGVIFVLFILAIGLLLLIWADGKAGFITLVSCFLLFIIGFGLNDAFAQNNSVTRIEIIPEDRYIYDNKSFAKLICVRGEGASIIWVKEIKSYEELDMFNDKTFLVVRKYVDSVFFKDYFVGYFMIKKSDVEKFPK